jgi:hypothetical protein
MKTGNPWYREPWPWIIMAGPAAAVVAGALTIWIAFATADGLVADDYYRQGLAINKVLAREDHARRLGIAARVTAEPGVRISVVLGGRMEPPQALIVRFVHVARAGHDREVELRRAEDRRYEAALPQMPPGRWRVNVEDAAREWRVSGEWAGGREAFTAAVLH